MLSSDHEGQRGMTSGIGHNVDIRAPGSGASFSIMKLPSFLVVQPLTDAAEQWLKDYASDEASWYGPGLVIEPRYLPLFVERASEEGMSFERDAYLN
jgi:hypothetical protein